jgi:hypothetical protein
MTLQMSKYYYWLPSGLTTSSRCQFRVCPYNRGGSQPLAPEVPMTSKRAIGFLGSPAARVGSKSCWPYHISESLAMES